MFERLTKTFNVKLNSLHHELCSLFAVTNSENRCFSYQKGRIVEIMDGWNVIAMSTRTQYSESEDDLEQLLDLDQPISSNWIVSSRESPIYASQLDQCTVLNSFNSKVNQSTDSGLDFSFNSSFSSIFPLEPEECVDGEGAAIQAQRGEFSGISEINPTPHELFVEQTQSSKYESQNLFSENYAAAQSSDEQRYSATENCIAVPPEINLLDPIVRLYANIKERYSDHAFVHTIAAQMCSELLPIDCCNSLKLGLLLSVVSTIVICIKHWKSITLFR